MILRETTALPCDVRGKTGALCGQAATVGLLRCDVRGWHITPICPSCATRIAASHQAMRLPPGKRPLEESHAA